MQSVKEVLAMAMDEEDLGNEVKKLFPKTAQDAGVTEESLSEKTAEVNAFASKIMNISASASAIIAAHHAALGAALNQLKIMVKKAGHKWQDWADKNVKIKARTREKAMTLARGEVDAIYYSLGKERIIAVLRVIKDKNLEVKANDILGHLLSNFDLNDFSALEEFKNRVAEWIKKTQEVAFSDQQSNGTGSGHPDQHIQAAPDTEVQPGQADSQQSQGENFNMKAACKVITLVPSNAKELNAEQEFQNAAIQLIDRGEHLIHAGKPLTCVLPELISRIRTIADALEALIG